MLAVKPTNTIISTVFSIGEDPVKLGLVTSLNRPGGNVTEVYQFTTVPLACLRQELH
jgi:putative ABC transport system substrate-binding protein